MSLWDAVRHRLAIVLRPGRYQREIDNERRFHLELDAVHQQHAAHGALDTLQALHAARRRYGNLTVNSEDVRAMAGLGFLDLLTQDVRFAVRSFRRAPAFSVVAILTLAIGIGANTAIFSAMDALIFRPLPFAEPERLMKVSLVRGAVGDFAANDDAVWSWPKYTVMRDAQKVFSGVALHTDFVATVRTHDDAERVDAEVTAGPYFTILGARPILGRVFVPEEDSRVGAPKVVMISYKYWQRRFNADSSIVNQPLQVGRDRYIVVGVLPDGFRGMSGEADLWMPLLLENPDAAKEPWGHAYEMVGRLNPGVSVAQAKAAVAVIGPQVDRAYPHPNYKDQRNGAMARELDATRIDPAVRQSLFILLGAVGIVLLIACANVANLFLVRASGRAREIAVRLAVGASRKRLIRQLLTESIALSTVGGALGIVIAYLGTRYLASFDAARTLRVRNLTGLGAVRFDSIHVSIPALAVALVLAVLTGVLFGLVPAIQATKPSLSDALKSARSSKHRGPSGAWNSRNVLVSAEIAMAFVLLAGSGLMLRSLGNLVAIAPGFGVEQLLTLRLNVREGTASDSMPGFYEHVMERLSAIAGVKGVTVEDCPPLNGGCNTTSIMPRDRPPVVSGMEPEVGVHWIPQNWNSVMGVPLLQGREFNSSDRRGSLKSIMVSAATAKRIWPGENPVGKPVSVGQGGFDTDTAYVVGVMGDVRYGKLDDPAGTDVYIPVLQSPRGRMMIMVRTAGDPLLVVASVRAALKELAPDLPVYDVRTMAERAADSTAYAKFVTVLLSAFGALALALATLGIYGVIAFSVSQRTREIGIRMALGARVFDVARMVVEQGLAVAAVGAIIGGVAAIATTRILQSLLFGVTPTDPWTFAVIVAVMASAVVAASMIPARRAATIRPTQALREE